MPRRPTINRLSFRDTTVRPAASRVPPPPEGSPNRSPEEAHLVNIILNQSNRRRASTDRLNCEDSQFVAPLEGESSPIQPPERPSHTHTPKPGFEGRGYTKRYVMLSCRFFRCRDFYDHLYEYCREDGASDCNTLEGTLSSMSGARPGVHSCEETLRFRRGRRKKTHLDKGASCIVTSTVTMVHASVIWHSVVVVCCLSHIN